MSRVWIAAIVLAGCGGKNEDPGTDSGTVSTALSIDSLTPDHAPVGSVVVIDGSEFGSDPGTVTVDGAPAEIVEWSDDSVTFTVPDLFPGARPVELQTAEGAAASADFDVVLPLRVYVSQGSDGKTDLISAFEVGDDGALTELDGSPYEAGAPNAFGFGGVPGNVAIDEAHRRLFTSESGLLAVFDIDPVTGGLTHAPGSPLALGVDPFFGVAVSPSGGDLYTTDCAAHTLRHFAVSATGELVEIGFGVPLGACGDQVLVTPDGAYAYVGLGTSTAAFALTDGEDPTPVAGSPFPLPSGSSYGRALSNGRLYAAVYDTDTVVGYTVEPDGSLTALAGSVNTALGSEPNGLVFSADGSVAYAALWNASAVAILDVGADGALTVRTTVVSPDEPAPLAMDPDGQWLFALCQAGSALAGYAIAQDGGLTSTGPAVDFGDGPYPQGMVVGGRR